MYAYCGNNSVNYIDPNGDIGVIPALLCIAAIITPVFFTSDVNQAPKYQQDAAEKYNKSTVNVYVEGTGAPKEDMLNVKVYTTEKGYKNINIDKSLNVKNEYEMEAVLNVIMGSGLYKKEIFGSKEFMMAQWIAHNESYNMAKSSRFGYLLVQRLSGAENPIASAHTLDIRQTDNMSDRSRLIYTVIFWTL